MRSSFHIRTRNAASTLASALALLLASDALAQSARQNISLVAGWNAVWLEVTPVYAAGHTRAGEPKAPADVFNSSQVIQVLSPKPLAGTAEFFAADPVDTGTIQQPDWEQWNSSSAIGDNLRAVTGNRPYLIETTAPTSLIIEGRVRFHRHTWTPDRYNLVGFGLDGAPTFNVFFAPSRGRHPVDQIFRLHPAGDWQQVTSTATMVSNEAYWIFCAGPSDYMGPVAVDFDAAIAGRLDFGGPGDSVEVDSGADTKQLDIEELIFTNLGPAPAVPRLELVTNRDPAAGSPADLELFAVRPAADGTLRYQSVARVDSIPDDANSPNLQENVATNRTAALSLGARRLWTTGLASRTTLYRLKPGGGAAFWLPVNALNSDISLPTDPLPQTPADSVAGLWVGEIIVNATTSLVIDGEPVQPVTSPAPLRLILHANANGAVRLLSQVILMQTRTADPAVAPIPVLVTDPAKIHYFEGVKERNGDKVGVRIATAAFDLPRKLDATSQAPLLADPAYPGLTAATLANFLVSQSTRPSSLQEIYELTWSLQGALGAGKTVRTAAGAPLTLDPFHRSNPFRHAFHQNHPRGTEIARELEILFDETQNIPGRLQGRYRETVTGLTKTRLISTGTITLNRLSNVASLN